MSKEVGEGEGRARWSGQDSGRSDDATSVDPFRFLLLVVGAEPRLVSVMAGAPSHPPLGRPQLNVPREEAPGGPAAVC